ncbi:MAG: c-type cytochrome [Anaerolineales bacterium]|nr:c-type cytochrome [Anaerolineales bacterium]
MKNRLSFLLVMVVLGLLLLAACGGSSQEAASGASSRPEPPAAYAGISNPKANDSAAVTAGEALYRANCASCHGDTGKGDGPAAVALDPSPQPLATTVISESDAYLYWRIAEGGAMAPFSSAMPAWKAILSEDQIWQIVAFLRTLGG